MHKLMISFDEKVFRELSQQANNRNISIQELLRAIIVPEWIKNEERATVTE